MRVAATFAHEIVQAERTPPIGEAHASNGRYYIPIPEGVKVLLDNTSFVLPSNNPGSIPYQAYHGLLRLFPQYSQVVFNPLLEAADMLELDPAGILHEGTPVVASHPARFQAGRGAGPLAVGTAPNSVALLAANSALGPGNDKPGVLVTTTLDIGPLTGGKGASEFVVFWSLLEFQTGVDVRATVGFFAGQNEPALRMVKEVEAEPFGFSAWLSPNGGGNFLEIQKLKPVAFCEPTTTLKIAFKNADNRMKRYVAGYALLF